MEARVDLADFSSGATGTKPELRCDLPDGWRPRAASATQAAAFYVRGNPRLRCHLTLLAGDGGGLVEIVNAWRLEYGLEPTDAAELERSARAQLLGREARIVDLESQGAPDQEKSSRVAVIACASEGTAILELSGPRDLVRLERGALLALARSLAVRG